MLGIAVAEGSGGVGVGSGGSVGVALSGAGPSSVKSSKYAVNGPVACTVIETRAATACGGETRAVVVMNR